MDANIDVAYSFIIPHKNTPSLLQRCIDTIPRRKDIQIIVVDDNSDTDKVNFEHFPGLDDPNVEVYLTKEGRGAGYARNVGLKHAIGKWLVFADADDYFTSDIGITLDEYQNSDADVVFLKNKAVKIPGGEPSMRGAELNRRVDIAIETGDFTQAVLYSSPWQKFFKGSFIESNHITFNEVRWGNDVVFMGKVAACATSFEASEKVIYCLTESDNSIIKDPSLASRIVRFEQESENVRILRSTKYRNEPSVYYWYFQTWFNIWKMSKLPAAARIPYAIFASQGKFIAEMFAAKFGNSPFIHALLHSINPCK